MVEGNCCSLVRSAVVLLLGFRSRMIVSVVVEGVGYGGLCVGWREVGRYGVWEVWMGLRCIMGGDR